jgi:iron complex transport system permease protein
MKTIHIVRFDGRLSLLLQTRALWLSCSFGVILAALVTTSLMNGSYPLSIADAWKTLLTDAPSDTAETVVWQFRFPRTLAAAFAGSLFGLSGAILQNITRNPLADPSLVGVSQGASLGVVAAIVVFPDMNQALRPIIAFAGALAVAALIQSIAMRRGQGATMRFILTGIGVAAFISSITHAMLTYGNIQKAQEALGWLSGSIHAAGWGQVWSLLFCLVVLTPLLVWATRYMSALRMGSEVAVGFGVRVRFARVGLITLSVALAAFAVSAVGPLGFVGLVAPHVERRIAQSGVGQQLILTALTGALMVTLADFVGRTAFAPIQIPAGILTAILGVPVFLFLIIKHNHNRQL